MKVNSKQFLIVIQFFVLTMVSCRVAKRQIVFPNDDGTVGPPADVQDRYASFQNPQFNFDRNPFWRNPFLTGQNFQFGRENQPQHQSFQPQQQQQQQVSTTVAPQVQACIDSCVERTPGQYNPICGDNNMTYHNEERFNCAVECGQNVQVMYRGACARPTLPPWQSQQVRN